MAGGIIDRERNEKPNNSWLTREIKKYRNGPDPVATLAFKEFLERAGRVTGRNLMDPALAVVFNKYEQLDYESIFFKGLSGGYNVRRSSGLVLVGTESDRQEHRDLLANTLGTRGDLHQTKDEVWVGLNLSNFGYLTTEVNRGIFEDSQKMAVFAYASLLGRRRELNYLVSAEVELWKLIVGRLGSELHLGLGSISKEQRGDQEVVIVKVNNQPEVFSRLERERAIRTLPFFPFLRSHTRLFFDSPRK